MLTALAAILDSILEPAYLIIVGPISLVAAAFIWLEHRADRIRKARAEENARTLAYIASLDDDLDREYEQRHRAQAPRRRGQDLPPIESIGDRSLDEIRREWDGGGSDAA